MATWKKAVANMYVHDQCIASWGKIYAALKWSQQVGAHHDKKEMIYT
jgi:hypothetical protein